MRLDVAVCTHLVWVLEGPTINAVVRCIQLTFGEPRYISRLEAACAYSLEGDVPRDGLVGQLCAAKWRRKKVSAWNPWPLRPHLSKERECCTPQRPQRALRTRIRSRTSCKEPNLRLLRLWKKWSWRSCVACVCSSQSTSFMPGQIVPKRCGHDRLQPGWLSQAVCSAWIGDTTQQAARALREVLQGQARPAARIPLGCK